MFLIAKCLEGVLPESSSRSASMFILGTKTARRRVYEAYIGISNLSFLLVLALLSSIIYIYIEDTTKSNSREREAIVVYRRVLWMLSQKLHFNS